MLISIEMLRSYSIQATDGEIGHVAEMYFDQSTWQVRYLIVDLGNWLSSRQVLLAPSAVTEIDHEQEQLKVSVTKEQIESSPDVATDRPISREKEAALHNHYQWPPYWVGLVGQPNQGAYSAAIAGRHYAARYLENGPENEDSTTSVDSNLRSTHEISGYQIQASDGDIGHVKDFLFRTENWSISYLIVDTGSWLPGRKVLIAPPWIEQIRWLNQRVYVDLPKESIRQSPPYSTQLVNEKDYGKQLLDHYKAWFSEFILELEQGEKDLFLGKDIIGNPLITVNDGRSIGRIKDIYLSADCKFVAGIYLGTEGLFSRKSFLVKSEDITTIGQDVILVRHADVVHEEGDLAETEKSWLRRDELQGRSVDTSGGTKVGKIGDVIINGEGKVLGFSFSYVYVTGPIADNRSIAIHTVQDVGNEDGVMTIDLHSAETQELSVA